MLLALGTVAIAAGMLDAVWPPTVWARREAVAVMAALALLDGADGPAVRSGEVGGALQVFGRTGGEDVAQGSHGRSPRMRALRRSEASSCPLWVRWKETIVVASWVCPRERCRKFSRSK